MKYFFDTEFIEGFHKPLFGKRRHFIDLISIGIVAEDGREYYAVSTDFDPKDADDWVKENVISKLPQKATSFYDSPRLKENSRLYKDNRTIANDIQDFCGHWSDDGSVTFRGARPANSSKPEFYAYYADYDWVVFCSLFGRMIDLPKGFPMYCRDLKQMLDEKVGGFPRDFEANLELLKTRPSYPQQENEHNALDDARWNFKLFNFLKSI